MTLQPSIEEVELRLRTLPAAGELRPADQRALTRLEEFEWRREPRSRKTLARPRIFASAVAALVLVALLNVIAAYFAPRYSGALADAPGIGPISGRVLGAMGLDSGNISAIGDSSTSSGHTLKLAAGYADGLRTVLFVSVDGKGLSGDPKKYGTQPGDYGLSPDATLTDQFGHSYDPSGVTGPTDLSFQPLAWPASQVGARLTLHVTALEAVWLMVAGEPSTVSGDWTLHVTLTSAPAHNIALPQAVKSDRAVYTFTSITASETSIVIHWTVSGPASDEMRSFGGGTPPPPDDLSRDYFMPQLFDARGTLMQSSDWGYTWPKTGPALGEMTAFIKGPGRYRIQLGAAVVGPDAQRWIDVP